LRGLAKRLERDRFQRMFESRMVCGVVSKEQRRHILDRNCPDNHDLFRFGEVNLCHAIIAIAVGGEPLDW